MKLIPYCIFCLFMVYSCSKSTSKNQENQSDFVSIMANDSLEKLDIIIDGTYFTSYLYADSILRKPVLFPIYTASQKRITRGYPIHPNAGERVDHPHHYGLWFNHGDVNDIDFWNSAVIPKKQNVAYGVIKHVKFIKIESGPTGTLEVEKEWRSNTDSLILLEQTRYIFSGDTNKRLITHTTTLTAAQSDVLFKDSKEGMFALRVRRELEVASDEPVILLNDQLQSSEVASPDNKKVSGQYRNSNGLEGYPDVWGKRAAWMQLKGRIDQDSVSICIFDHPGNLNHPPHWMARDYGLFGVNAMGSTIYTNGKEQLNYTLEKGKSITFKQQVIILDGSNPSHATIESFYQDFLENTIN